MGRFAVGLGGLALVVCASACLVGRDLTLVEGESAASAATPTNEDELVSGDAPEAGTKVGASSDAGAKSTGKDAGSGTKDAGADAKPPPQPGGCVAEVEPNDQAVEGIQLTAGMTACGELIVGSDVDWYQFNLGQGGTTTIAFVTDGDAYVAIAGLNGGSYVGTNDFKTTFQGSGAFYVRIYSPNTKAQAYRITRE